MLNKVFIMGRLTRDPELRRTQRGTPVTSFSLAVDRDFKSQGGEKETDFIDVVAWSNTAEFVAKDFTKGRMAIVEGRLQLREYTDRDGNKRRAAEVVADNVYFGDSKRDGDNSGSYGGNTYGGNNFGGNSYGNNNYGGYNAPAPSYGGYNAPAAAPASDFAMLEDDDAQLPF